MLKRTFLLTVLTGGTLLAGLVPARAQPATAPRAYYVAEFELRDPEGIRPYSTGVTATLEPFGGRFVVRAGSVAALEGSPPGPRTVIIEFPSMERATAWYGSEAYRNLRPVRQRSGISRTYIIEGLQPLPLVQTDGANTMQTTGSLTSNDVRAVAPALDRYLQVTVQSDLWKRPDLSPRDRSIVTLSALIARNLTIGLPLYTDMALDSGVTPVEISEIITHLALYSGLGNAMHAIAAVKEVFARRGIGADQLPPAEPELLPLDEAAEAQRAARVGQDVGPVAPGLHQFTTDLLFRDLWLRPGLAPRDRSLVTVSALIAAGQVAQVTYHLNRAMDNGFTRAQAAEVATHLAFYAGWPNAMSAIPVMKGVFDSRRE